MVVTTHVAEEKREIPDFIDSNIVSRTHIHHKDTNSNELRNQDGVQ